MIKQKGVSVLVSQKCTIYTYMHLPVNETTLSGCVVLDCIVYIPTNLTLANSANPNEMPHNS